MDNFSPGADLPVDHATYRHEVGAWLDANAGELREFRTLPPDLTNRIRHLVRLRHALWDTGPARHGWPERFGGVGGDALHRGILLEQLARRGYPPPMALDHLEIIAPTLAQFLEGDQAIELVSGTLRGDVIWCQGFSEPEAGSDLTSLRTRAVEADDGWRVSGQKIWCSWTNVADRCLFLARTGQAGSRGLTMFQIPVDSPGLTYRPIMQANGQPEFSEVFFDEVPVGTGAVVGAVDGGWNVARFLLSCERGAFAWQRHAWLGRWLGEAIDKRRDDETDDAFADAAIRILALRALSRRTLRMFAGGTRPEAEASVDKIVLSRTEHLVFDTIRRSSRGDLELGVAGQEAQELYLASRLASVYGGAREIQMNLVAQRLMGLPRG